MSAGEAAARGFAGHHGLRLRDSGLSEGTGGLHVWLHAGAAAGHDFHAGAGSFAAAVAGLERAAGRRIAVSTLLTRSNARVLVELPGLLQAHGVSAWRVVAPRLVGTPVRAPGGVQVAGVGALDGLLPRLSVALPPALQALALARRLGLAIAVVGAPLCLLGPFAGVSLPGRGVFAAACEGCAARARCPGVDAGYLDRFGGDELSPRGLRAAEGAPAPAELFLGTGVLEQVATDMSPGTGPARRRLPVIAGDGRAG